MTFQFIHNFIDPNDPDGRSYKQINAEKEHQIPIGSLVEDIETGIRMFVVLHTRDCDMTPLYWLAPDKDDTERDYPNFANRKWDGGYPESSLVVIRKPVDDGRDDERK